MNRSRGAKYRKLREKAKLSREELASVLGMKDVSAVRHWERGASKPRDITMYAKAVGTDANTVLAAG